ncbi:hypothetical protein AAG906_002119 [Vitis piasezkii]
MERCCHKWNTTLRPAVEVFESGYTMQPREGTEPSALRGDEDGVSVYNLWTDLSEKPVLGEDGGNRRQLGEYQSKNTRFDPIAIVVPLEMAKLVMPQNCLDVHDDAPPPNSGAANHAPPRLRSGLSMVHVTIRLGRESVTVNLTEWCVDSL